MQTPFEKAKEALTVANELLCTCRNYYVLGVDDRATLGAVMDATQTAEQRLQVLILRAEA